jgi:hypothetical protein
MAKLLGGTRVYGTGTVDSTLYVNGNVSSAGTNSGSLVVYGGAGISGNLWVGGTINGTVSSGTNISGGTTGQIPYQSAANTTLFFGPGTAGQTIVSNGAAAPSYTSTLSLAGNIVNMTSSTVVGTSYANKLQITGGSAGVYPTFQSTGTDVSQGFQFITSYFGAFNVFNNFGGLNYQTFAIAPLNGTPNGWVSLRADAITDYNQYSGSGGPQILAATGQSNASLYLTPTGLGNVFIQSTKVASATGTGALVVGGGAVIRDTTNSTSTQTGSLIVQGGLGVAKDIYFGGNLYQNGSLFVGGGGGGGSSTATYIITEQIVAAATTTFTVVGGYTVGTLQLFANGVLLSNADYTASNGTSVVLNRARQVGDTLRFQNMGGSFFNTATNTFRVTEVVATANGQTVFTVGYNTGTSQVFLNGVQLNSSDYTATNGTSVTLASGVGVFAGHILRVVSFQPFLVSGALPLSGGTVNGTVNVQGTLKQNNVPLYGLTAAMSIALGI